MSDIFFTVGSIAFVKPPLIHWLALLFAIAALFISCRAASIRLVKHNQRKWFVIIINVISILAITGFIFQPSWKSTEGQVITLITSSTDESNSPSKNLPDFLWYRPTKQQVEVFQIDFEQIIFSPEQLNLRYPKINKLIIRGDGLTSEEWQRIDADKIEYSSASITPGFVNPQWRKQVNIGDFFSVSGKVRAGFSESLSPVVKSKILKVELIDPAGQVVAANDTLDGEYFHLQHRPKLLGNHIYKIELSRLVKNVKEIIASEKVGFSVIEQPGLDLLILQSAPSFETKQLQNWAAESGASILVKSQISKDKFISKQINFADLKQDNLSRELFEQFDLMVADSRALVLLNPATSEALLESIRNGLGIIVLADYSQLEDANSSHWLQKEFRLINEDSQDSAQLYWSNDNAGLVSQSEVFLPRIQARFEKTDNLQSQVFSSDGEVLVSSIERGKGKIGLSLVRETARWVTSGELTIYSHYWQSLIRQISRRAAKKQIDLFGISNILSENQRARVCINDIDSSSLTLRSPPNSQQVLLQSSKSNGNSKCGLFWPEASWSTIEYTGEKGNIHSQSFYAASTSDWKTHHQILRISASLNRANKTNQSKSLDAKNFIPISLWWFWWILMASAFLLWIEKKFFDESLLV